MLHVPLESADGIFYLSVPLGYRLWTKELSKLELGADMVRSVKGIEKISNRICISYAAVKLLLYYSREFQGYQGQSLQEIRYQVGEKIRMNIIIHSYLPLKKAFQELMRQYGYL